MSAPVRDPLDVEQRRVRLAALITSAVAGLVAVVSLGLYLWVWAIGSTAFALAAGALALRMYAAMEDYRRMVAAQQRPRAQYKDPYEDRPESE